jgi:hypothetical protein
MLSPIICTVILERVVRATDFCQGTVAMLRLAHGPLQILATATLIQSCLLAASRKAPRVSEVRIS